MAKKLVLRELHDPIKAGQLPPTLDLILVHGLDGDPLSTWTHPSASAPWPSTLLPSVRPRTRVLSFGYNAAAYHNTTTSTIRDNARSLLTMLHARRRRTNTPAAVPLLFLGHCLGGLVVKQALCFAHGEPEFAALAAATRGVFFFATPHGGADKAAWRAVAKGYSPLAGKASGLVQSMMHACDDLQEIREDFVKIATRFPITSFYQKDEGATGRIIVSDTSARMVVDNELAVPVVEDHVGICRFESEEDMAFEILVGRIEEAVGRDELGGRGDGGVEEKEEGVVRGAVVERKEHGKKVAQAWATAGVMGDGLEGYVPKRAVLVEFEKEPATGHGGVQMREAQGRKTLPASGPVEELPWVSSRDAACDEPVGAHSMQGSNEGRGRRVLNWIHKRRS